MALKGDRYELQGDIHEFGNSLMTRGGVACYQTLGSGGSLDQSVSLIYYPNSSSGATPKGILMQDMVSYDLTRQHLNWYRDEVQIGGKLLVLVKGYVNTNSIIPGAAPIIVGDRAVLNSSGQISNISQASEYAGSWNKQLNPPVGRFLSTLDEDGYATVSVTTE
jgi:hypothetical protein